MTYGRYRVRTTKPLFYLQFYPGNWISFKERLYPLFLWFINNIVCPIIETSFYESFFVLSSNFTSIIGLLLPFHYNLVYRFFLVQNYPYTFSRIICFFLVPFLSPSLMVVVPSHWVSQRVSHFYLLPLLVPFRQSLV